MASVHQPRLEALALDSWNVPPAGARPARSRCRSGGRRGWRCPRRRSRRRIVPPDGGTRALQVVAQHPDLALQLLHAVLPEPLERRVRLRHEAADDGAAFAFFVYLRPIFTTSRASSLMPSVSSSISVGTPIRKYSFTGRQPWDTPPTAANRSSSLMSLLITRRIRHVPPSGANVRPVRRTFWISLAMPTVNASTRSDGSETPTLPHPYCSTRCPATQPVDARVVRGRQRRERDLVVAGAARPSRPSCARSSGRSRTGRVIIPAWQNRQPRCSPGRSRR